MASVWLNAAISAPGADDVERQLRVGARRPRGGRRNRRRAARQNTETSPGGPPLDEGGPHPEEGHPPLEEGLHLDVRARACAPSLAEVRAHLVKEKAALAESKALCDEEICLVEMRMALSTKMAALDEDNLRWARDCADGGNAAAYLWRPAGSPSEEVMGTTITDAVRHAAHGMMV